MKNLLTLILTIGMSFSIHYANAQCSSGPPCLPDCPATTFGPTSTIQITVQPGCVLEVTYASRIACGIWYDYYISGIQIIQFSGCPFASTDVALIVELAQAGLMDANPAGFPPSLPVPPATQNCDINWRVVKGGCWEQSGDCILPCTPTNCCLTSYRVCVDAAGNKTIDKLGNISGPPAPCPIGSSGNQCVDVCN